MDELAKLLSYKINQLSEHSNPEEPKRSVQQRALTAQEVQTASSNCTKTDLCDLYEAISAVMFTL